MSAPDPYHLELLLGGYEPPALPPAFPVCRAPGLGMTVTVTDVQGRLVILALFADSAVADDRQQVHERGLRQNISGVGTLHIGVV